MIICENRVKVTLKKKRSIIQSLTHTAAHDIVRRINYEAPLNRKVSALNNHFEIDLERRIIEAPNGERRKPETGIEEENKKPKNSFYEEG